MTQKQNTNQTLEALKAELEVKEAEQKGLTSHKRALKRKIAELEAANAATTVVESETEVKDVDAASAVVESVPEVEDAETPDEEVEVAEEVTETPDEEEEVAEEVTETPDEEAEVTEEVIETPDEEEEVAEEVTETPDEEEEVAEEVTETPDEEAEVTEEVIEIPDKEEEVTEEKEKPKPKKKVKKTKESKGSGVILPALMACAIILLAGALLVMCLPYNRVDEQIPPAGTEDSTDTTDPVVDPDNPVDTDEPVDPDDPVDSEKTFDMSTFKQSVANIAAQLTEDEDVTANADIFVENIGEDKLVELVEKYGELNTQKAIAEMLVFVPEIKMQQYVAKNNLDFNPDANSDYDMTLQAADAVYRTKTGKNPDGALMSLEGYDTYKSNREAIKALIVEAGDIALLEWYTAKTEGFDLMIQQNRDTEQAENYKNEVKLELVNSAGAIKLLELQLEKETAGNLTVMDNVSMQYTEEYEQFILNNYMYVVAF